MCKVVLVVGVLCAVLVGESWCQVRLIHPTYRPPPQRPIIIRTAREAPLWLYQDADIPRAPPSSQHPSLPDIIDDIKLDPNTRTARSLPRLEPWRPTPFNPRIPLPDFPRPRPLVPIYARHARDVEEVVEQGPRVARNAPHFPRPTPFNPRAPNPFPRPPPRSSFPTLARVGRDTEHVQLDSQEFLHDVYED